jgi:predicted RNase H-like nuclease (RuvC/YqgF family)
MSEHAQRENAAIEELGALVRHLADELASFRRRALTAESKLKEMEGVEGGAVNVDLAQRCAKLEQDNERLQSKLDAATTRAKQMLDRVKFLRQQAQLTGADR